MTPARRFRRILTNSVGLIERLSGFQGSSAYNDSAAVHVRLGVSASILSDGDPEVGAEADALFCTGF